MLFFISLSLSHKLSLSDNEIDTQYFRRSEFDIDKRIIYILICNNVTQLI